MFLWYFTDTQQDGVRVHYYATVTMILQTIAGIFLYEVAIFRTKSYIGAEKLSGEPILSGFCGVSSGAIWFHLDLIMS